jgi:hypothetical protein
MTTILNLAALLFCAMLALGVGACSVVVLMALAMIITKMKRGDSQ